MPTWTLTGEFVLGELRFRNPPIILFPINPIEPSYTSIDRTTFLLSGGGAKGCFQAGAIGYLFASEREEYRPHLTCGTSVGALNAILTTESSILGDVSRVKQLWQIWLDLNWKTDFFDISPAVARFDSEHVASFTGLGFSDLGDYYLGGGYTLHEDEIPRVLEVAGGAPATEVKIIFAALMSHGIAKAIGGQAIVAGAGIGGYVLFEKAIDDIDEAQKIRAIYTLLPLRRLISRKMDASILSSQTSQMFSADDVKNGLATMRLVSVEASGGRICWVDERGHFHVLQNETLPNEIYIQDQAIDTHIRLFGRLQTATGRVPLSAAEVIIEGALGSAAIPLAFEPGVLFTSNVDDLDITTDEAFALLDGGVKDLVPSQAAIPYLNIVESQRLKSLVVTIGNQPRYATDFFGSWNRSILEESEHPDTYNGKPSLWTHSQADLERIGREDVEGIGILDIALRSLDLQGSEIGRTDLNDLALLPFEIEGIEIAPTFRVNDTGQIDKGLTRISLAYGWMRAFDVDYLRSTNKRLINNALNPTPDDAYAFFLLYRNTDLITRLRMNCWRLQMACRPDRWPDDKWDSTHMIFGEGIIDSLRRTKRRIAELIDERVLLVGDFDGPMYPSIDWMPDSQPNDWLDWEHFTPNSFWFSNKYNEEIEGLRSFISSYDPASHPLGPSILEDAENNLPILEGKFASLMAYFQSNSLWDAGHLSDAGDWSLPAVISAREVRPTI